MKKIGIIGGISPTSTKLYYDLLIKSSLDVYHCYPEIIIYSVDLNACWTWLSKGNVSDLGKKFLSVISSLKKAGADYAVISAVSMHIAIEGIKEKTPLPIIDGWKCLVQSIRKDKKKNILLLGTDYVMQSDTFLKYFNDNKIHITVPNKEERQVIEDIIKNQLNKGIIRNASKQKLVSVAHAYKDEVDGVCLACTALPAILHQSDFPTLKLYNFVEIHVEKIIHQIEENLP